MSDSLSLNEIHHLWNSRKRPVPVNRNRYYVVNSQRQLNRVPIKAQQVKEERDYLAESLENYQRQLAELKPFESIRGLVHFSIRTADGKEVQFKANSSESIFFLRINIEKVLNVRRRDQKLVFRGNIINDGQSIHQAGITNGAVVHLIEVKDFNK